MQNEEATITWCLGLVLEQLISVRTQKNRLDLQIQNIFLTKLSEELTW